MKKLYAYLSIFTIFFLSSCGVITKKAEGPIIEKQLFLDAFESINVKGSMNVFVTYGEEVEVRVTGEEEAVNSLNTSVSGKNWDIQFGRLFSDHSVKVYITSPFLKKASISSSGDLDIDRVVQPYFTVNSSSSGQIRIQDVSDVSEELSVRTTSSGNIEIENVTTEKVNAEISSSGSITLYGKSLQLTGALSSSGRLKAENLEVDHGKFTISSSGNVYTHTNKTLIGRLSSSGSLYYRGNPSFDVNTSSSGSLKKMD
ncbi:DUF2807 domain-containing protein [Flammeovirga sp. MY04]|uniref:head GIN domain-containing protein n=1 Tax=Flammeovirga sp. MY04 TaxID=1191459 RepID=UPI0008063DCF|nr:head GIN domain-containing protein [Flammeovirga sp. MY04]ANQ47689.1 DUF2807 domain-containing protein [Flammeovirga sp. MY04]